MFKTHFIFCAQDTLGYIIQDARVPWPRPNGFKISDDIRNAMRELERLRPWAVERKGAKLLKKMVRWFSERGPFATLPADISTRIFSEFVQMVTPLHVFYDNTGRRYVAHVPEMYFVVALWRENLVDSEARVRAIVANARRRQPISAICERFRRFHFLLQTCVACAVLVQYALAWIYGP